MYAYTPAFSGDTEGLIVHGRSSSGEVVELWYEGSDTNNPNTILLVACSSSSAGCSDQELRVENDGDVFADGSFTGGGADFADLMPVAGDVAMYEPGDVLVIGQDGNLTLSSKPYSKYVVGVYSTQPAFVGDPRTDDAKRDLAASALDGDEVERAPFRDGLVPVALAGVVPVKASAENGPIQPGDLLTTASLPGHAMRCEGIERCFGSTLGKALEALDSGEDLISMLVLVQ